MQRVLYRIDLDPLKAKALWYLFPDDLAALHRRLATHRERLVDLAGSGTLHDLFARINREITTTLVGRVFTGFLDDDEADEFEEVEESVLDLYSGTRNLYLQRRERAIRE